MKRRFREYSKLRESHKSLRHELGYILKDPITHALVASCGSILVSSNVLCRETGNILNTGSNPFNDNYFYH